MKLQNARIAQVLVPVDDLPRAVVFYRDVLGLPFLFEAVPQMAFFNCGGIRLLVGVPPAGVAVEHAATIYFEVADMATVFGEIKASGAAFTTEPHVVHRTPVSALWLAEFKDPFGNQLALSSEVKTGGA